MAELPEPIQRTLAKGVAAYVRATASTELPPSVAAMKKTVQTPKGLGRHREQLLAVLDDDALRARVLEWLEDGKPPLSKAEITALRLAAERPEGWADRLADTAPARPVAKTESPAALRELEEKLEREKEAHRKAREEVKRVKESGRVATKAERDRSLRLDEEVSNLRDAVRERDSDLQAERGALARALKEVERLKRKLRADVDGLREQLKKVRDENRELKKRITAMEREARDAAKPNPVPRTAPPAPARTGPRSVLDVPKGRLEDAPETLDAWLRTPNVSLLVDGYNVTRSPNGYPDLSLEQQRDRLRADLKRLANRLKVATVLVWDGAEVAPGTKRLSSGYVTEEYSEPDRSGAGTDKDRADRHIVSLLKKMPPDPVVVVTNDRGLQEEARAHNATIATSTQLLALLS